MTYNIRLGIQHGVAAIAQVINTHRPNVVALQEVGKFWSMGPDGDTLKDLARLCDFGHFKYVRTIEQEHGHQYGHALLSSWPIQTERIFSFTQKIDEPRAALISTLESPNGPIDVVSTHLSHRPEERAHQAPQLIELLEELRPKNRPIILLGDLNATDQTDWMGQLLSWMDSTADFTRAATFPNPQPDQRIDHILTYRAQITHAEVLQETEASDHRPLVADILYPSD